jgi:biopolymer transport protein ExbD
MKINLDGGTDEVRIEILPLIDVIFCILTFFILAALQLTRQQGIAVDLPSATTGVPQIRQVFVVSVDVLGQVYVEQQPVTIDQLKQQLVGYKQLNPEGMMVLYAPRNAIYEDVVSVLDILRSVGGDRVALATIPTVNQPSGQPSPIVPGLPVPGLPTAPQSPLVTPSPGTIPPTLRPDGSLPGSPIPGQSIPVNPQGLPGTIPNSGIPGTIQPSPAPSTPGAPATPNTPRPQLPLP